MNMPDDLFKDLKKLSETWKADHQEKRAMTNKKDPPSAAEIDRFLVGYGLSNEDLVERIEIRDPATSDFQFMMLAIWRKEQDEVSLAVMWPEGSGE
jgi:hypothetical protein